MEISQLQKIGVEKEGEVVEEEDAKPWQAGWQNSMKWETLWRVKVMVSIHIFDINQFKSYLIISIIYFTLLFYSIIENLKGIISRALVHS